MLAPVGELTHAYPRPIRDKGAVRKLLILYVYSTNFEEGNQKKKIQHDKCTLPERFISATDCEGKKCAEQKGQFMLRIFVFGIQPCHKHLICEV